MCELVEAIVTVPLSEIRETQLLDTGPGSKRYVRHRLPGDPRRQAAV